MDEAFWWNLGVQAAVALGLAPVLRIVPPAVSGDTVRTCEYLLQEARAGRLVGLAWVGIRPGSEYEGDIIGNGKG